MPPQFASWGAPPPPWYIDALMRHIGEPYYVGLLKAAELHGATHQAVMEFQVVTAKRLPKIKAGRNLVAFYYRKNMAAVVAGIEDRKTDTGIDARVGSRPHGTRPAALFARGRRPRQCGNGSRRPRGEDRRWPAGRLSAAAERPVVQRLGYLLDRLGQEKCASAMYAALMDRGAVRWTELDSKETGDPDFALPEQGA